jgi:hypothetical protein
MGTDTGTTGIFSRDISARTGRVIAQNAQWTEGLMTLRSEGGGGGADSNSSGGSNRGIWGANTHTIFR